jgi:hypothetical protein
MIRTPASSFSGGSGLVVVHSTSRQIDRLSWGAVFRSGQVTNSHGIDFSFGSQAHSESWSEPSSAAPSQTFWTPPANSTSASLCLWS